MVSVPSNNSCFVYGPLVADGLVGKSPAMQEVCEHILRVGPLNMTVLLEGETGTGKELVARALHRHSPRSERPFVAVNCATLQDQLLESDLFGHEKGAFTGADRRKPGKFELADTGTLFLDEVAEFSLTSQAKLLRVLQERSFERVGGNETLAVDVRVIAATNQNLAERVNAGRFRPDLYYRLNDYHIKLPPLRDRREDIPLLVDYFLQRNCPNMDRRVRALEAGAWGALQSYPFPGNVRELESAMRTGLANTSAAVVTMIYDALPRNVRADHTDDSLARQVAARVVREVRAGHVDVRNNIHTEVDRVIFATVLEIVTSKEQAIKALGISRTTLWEKIRALGLAPGHPEPGD